MENCWTKFHTSRTAASDAYVKALRKIGNSKYIITRGYSSMLYRLASKANVTCLKGMCPWELG